MESASAGDTVQCAACGAAVSTSAAGPARVVRCTGCGAVLDVAPVLGGAMVPAAEPRSLRSAPRVPMPLDVKVRQDGAQWVVELPRSVGTVLWMPILGAATTLVALLLLVMPGLPWEVMVASGVLALLGGYTLVQGLVNRLRVVADGGRVDVRWGPLPWLDGGTGVPRVQHVAVRRWVYTVREDNRGPSSGSWNVYAFRWDLVALTPEGNRVPLVEGLWDPFLPLWLQQRLAEHLQLDPPPDAEPRSPQP